MNAIKTLNYPAVAVKSVPFKWVYKMCLAFCLFSIIALSIFYIVQATAAISETYSIQRYENRLEDLKDNNKELAFNSIEINLLNEVYDNLENLNFVKAESISYITVLNGVAVTK